MKILITGGAGYVGAALVPALLSEGHQVTVLDLMIYGEDVLDDHKHLTKIKGDIRNQNLLKKIIPGNNVLIHLACISNDPSFELNPKLGKSINFDAFQPLVNICKKEKVERFIYASSSSVYGIKKEKNVTEDMHLEPLTDYSKFKAQCEDILNKSASDDFIVSTIRPSTVCGFSKRQRLDLVVNILTNHGYHNRKIKVFGGKQLRPNIHIDDMVNSYLVLLKANSKKINREIFNVGFKNQTVNELAYDVKSVLGNDIDIVNSISNDNRSYHVNSDKIFNILGFKPKKTVKNAVEDLKKAFDQNLLPNSFKHENYFNIKKMNSIDLK
jgi:nucleoside-diphosphate-sugar epimerase